MNKHRANAEDTTNWTSRKLLEWTAAHLDRKGVDSPRLSAEMLLAHILHVPRINLFMDMDRPASPLERAAFRDLVERAAEHEPVQYLVGHAHLYSLQFAVNRHVLIPRPSTETLIEHIIQHTRTTPGFASPSIVDIGTGSGAIAVALAVNLPEARIVATDISPDALELAKQNAARHDVADRIDFRLGDLYEPLSGPFHYVVSNPPYISDAEWEYVERNVKDYEPVGALRGGVDGLDQLRPLIAHASEHLAKPGQLVLEIAASQKQAVLDLAKAAKGLTNPRVLADHEKHPRMLLADRAT
ncbi:MAG: peptide chain release factor N(5)-glutamine methyltransferase [Phycisphaera sp.]|nr:peptide chain release factor N(5)-glutamine methyltransferase [Phycisphaera sp.]